MLRNLGQSTGNIPKNYGQCDRGMLFFAIFSVTFVHWSDCISATDEPFEASLVSFDRALNALSMASYQGIFVSLFQPSESKDWEQQVPGSAFLVTEDLTGVISSATTEYLSTKGSDEKSAAISAGLVLNESSVLSITVSE